MDFQKIKQVMHSRIWSVLPFWLTKAKFMKQHINIAYHFLNVFDSVMLTKTCIYLIKRTVKNNIVK